MDVLNPKQLAKFERYLKDVCGCEILPATNQFELLRFRGSDVGVVYSTGKFSGPYVASAIKAYRSGVKWSGGPVNVGRKNNYKSKKKQILKRDGTKCFFCNEEMEDDVTLEHLTSLVSGGKNTLGNMVLAHEKCNNDAKNKTVVEKVNIAVKNRISKN